MRKSCVPFLGFHPYVRGSWAEPKQAIAIALVSSVCARKLGLTSKEYRPIEFHPYVRGSWRLSGPWFAISFCNLAVWHLYRPYSEFASGNLVLKLVSNILLTHTKPICKLLCRYLVWLDGGNIKLFSQLF